MSGIPQILYNLLKSKSLILWTPFNESNHQIGYTPNVANESDGSINMVPLNTMEVGEGIVNGDLKLIDGKTGITGATTTNALKIAGDITIVIWYKFIDTPGTFQDLVAHGVAGETSATNYLYGIRLLNTREIQLVHEYGAGSNVLFNTGVIFPNDNMYHMVVMRRNSIAKTWSVTLDNEPPIEAGYTTNPDGGVNGKLYVGGYLDGSLVQADGEYPDLFIFDEVLSNDDIDIFFIAGISQNNWFNYTNWNDIGSGYVSWIKSTGVLDPLVNWISTYGYSAPEIQNGLLSSYGYYDMDVLDASVIINIVDKVLILLVEQFEESENLHDFFKILLTPAQDIEYTLGDMISMKNIANGTGDRLDISGAIVGEERKFRTDDIYRRAIYSKIILNKSYGEPEVLINAIKILTNATIINCLEYYPAWAIFQFTTFNPLPENLLKTIEPIAPAGVKITLTYNNTNNPSFAFSGEGGLPDLPETEGFSETNYLENNQFIGGVFHELITK